MRTDEKRYWKKRIPKSTRFDKIVDSFVDWLIETGQTLDTSVKYIQEVCLQDWSILRNSWSQGYNKSYQKEVQYSETILLMEGLLKDSLRWTCGPIRCVRNHSSVLLSSIWPKTKIQEKSLPPPFQWRPDLDWGWSSTSFASFSPW